MSYAPNASTGYPPYPPTAPSAPQAQNITSQIGFAQPGFQPNIQPGYQRSPGQQSFPTYTPPTQSPYPPIAPINQPYSPPSNFSYSAPQQGSYIPPGYQPVSQGTYAPPIVTQPQSGDGGWMNIPRGIPNCPPGLEYLTTIDQLLVKQKVELLEAFTGFETNNKYTIRNSLGQKVYWAVEENDCCTRNCCGPMRPFNMKIMDNYKNVVVHLNRPLACESCCFPCCLQKMEVSSPPGNYIGSIEQEWSILYPEFSIKNAAGESVMRITGPICRFSIFGDIEFKILTLAGDQVGKISKQWSGLVRELFTDADFFGITFPMDLDVKMKAVMLGACFLIDAMFFEKSGNQETDRPGML